MSRGRGLGSLPAGPAFGVRVLQQAGRVLGHSPRTAESQLYSLKGREVPIPERVLRSHCDLPEAPWKVCRKLDFLFM